MHATSSSGLDELLRVPAEDILAESAEEGPIEDFAVMFQEALTSEQPPREPSEEKRNEGPRAVPLLDDSEPAPESIVVVHGLTELLRPSSPSGSEEDGGSTDEPVSNRPAQWNATPTPQQATDVEQSPHERSVAPLEIERSQTGSSGPREVERTETGKPSPEQKGEEVARNTGQRTTPVPVSSEARAAEVAAEQPLRRAPPVLSRPAAASRETGVGELDHTEIVERLRQVSSEPERSSTQPEIFEQPGRNSTIEAPELLLKPQAPSLPNSDPIAAPSPTGLVVPTLSGAAAVDSAAPATPTTPAAAAQPVEALPHQVEILARQGGGTARIRLHPAGLGEVEITVAMRGNTVEVVIRAEESAAQATVLAHREQLADSLSARDLRMQSFDVLHSPRDENGNDSRSFDGFQRQPYSDGEQPRSSAAGSNGAIVEPATPSPAARAGIDLRI